MSDGVDWTSMLRQLQATEQKIDELRRSLSAGPAGVARPGARPMFAPGRLQALGNRVEGLAPAIVRADNQQRQTAERARAALARLHRELSVRLGLLALPLGVLIIAALLLLLRR